LCAVIAGEGFLPFQLLPLRVELCGGQKVLGNRHILHNGELGIIVIRHYNIKNMEKIAVFNEEHMQEGKDWTASRAFT
jgi:hypothetical protein